MRAFRAVAAVLLSTAVLAGCGSSGDGGGGGDDAPPASATAPAAGSEPGSGASTSPPPAASAPASPSVSPAAPTVTEPPAASATAGGTPAATETLVRVSRSGGFAGDTHTLAVKGDGSWSRLDRTAKPEGAGKLSPDRLGQLRTALREADFAGLPRLSTGSPKVYDGFVYAFVHGGHEVAAEQEALPPVLAKILDALPPFTAG
ncbi:hypothetical protein ACFWUZ_15275 [Streptomyces sp. NPDC058646]|uniref:hypothetical protein n=1 Tax=Streptomyces sp. NPDC058646 TaxID=3346574 RepID=UPI00364DAB01